MQLAWDGSPPPRVLAGELRDAGFDILRHAVDASLPLVVFTASGRTPPSRGGPGAWIWVTAGPADDRRRRRAVLRGAYAVVSLEEPAAAATLAARLRELLVSDPVPPAPSYLVAESGASKRILSQIARVAPTSMPVLITGETGTGKEVAARLLHAWSPRQEKRFVPINCAAIPDELMEA